MNDLRYWLLLQSIEGIGPVTFRNLLKTYSSPKFVFEVDRSSLLSIHRFNEKVIDSILQAKYRLNDIDQLLEQLRNRNIKIVTIIDSLYPNALKILANQPPIIYISRPLDFIRTFGVIGTRDASQYGKEQAEKFAKELVSVGYTIVSGYAKGIDTAAHFGAISAGGQTVAVLPTGILKHQLHQEFINLQEIFMQQSFIFSEFFPTREWSVGNALLRNRITAALSDYILVIESGDSGGTLNTVEQAKILAKKVFIYKGIASAMDEKIIQLGAIPVSNVKEIISQLDK